MSAIALSAQPVYSGVRWPSACTCIDCHLIACASTTGQIVFALIANPHDCIPSDYSTDVFCMVQVFLCVRLHLRV